MKTGRKYNRGYLVYIGKEVTTEEIIAKLVIPEDVENNARAILQSFMVELSALKIGNVVSVLFPESIRCILKKEAEAPTTDHKKKLP
jgi:hypothetical protein